MLQQKHFAYRGIRYNIETFKGIYTIRDLPLTHMQSTPKKDHKF